MRKHAEGLHNLTEFLQEFQLHDFNIPAKVEIYERRFKLNELLSQELIEDKIDGSKNLITRTVSPVEGKPYAFEISDLARLHWLALTRKSINILEFGSGYSTLIFAHAMKLLKDDYSDWVGKNLRVEKPFHVYSVEENYFFAEITAKRLGSDHEGLVTIHPTSVELSTFNDQFCTFYAQVPNISPDLIYLDGPSQFATHQSIRGFSIASVSRMPMSGDILAMEFFLEPGTLIIVDGRSANAQFLKYHLKRNWSYIHDFEGDYHLFELKDPALGKLNKAKLQFCLDGKYLLN